MHGETAKKYTRHVFLYICMFVCFWCKIPKWAAASSFTRFLDHNAAPQSVGLLWKSDQFVAETFA